MQRLIQDSELQRFYGNDVEFLAELASILTQFMPPAMAMIREAIDVGDAEAVRNIAHTISSRTGYFFCPSLVELSRSMEALAVNQDLASTLELVPKIQMGIEQLLDELRQRTGQELSMEWTD
jgi:HPt (histidine-containing phosphotransfer) domain-containing protein